MPLPTLSAAPVSLRHIKLGTTGATTVLGASLVPQAPTGINGRRGWQNASIDLALNEEGTGTLRLHNAVGDDGVLHRRRFLYFTASTYHPGDEWIEVYQEGRVLFAGTPIDGERSRSTVTLQLADGAWMLNTQRETAAGFWSHAPRDVFEHYTKAWQPIVADDFDAGANTARWTKNTSGGGTITDQTGSVKLAGSCHITARNDYYDTTGLGTERAWRCEMTYTRNIVGGTIVQANSTLQLVDPADGTGANSITLSVGSGATLVQTRLSGTNDSDTTGRQNGAYKANATMAIEVRDRFVFFYVDGALIAVHELSHTSDTLGLVVPRVSNGTLGDTTVHSLVMRRADPYMLRGATKGDYRLPGTMPSGGLQGRYYDEAQHRALAIGNYLRRTLVPTRQPYAIRQDATINFPAATPPTWQPTGPASGAHFSVRWTGAIYLDLATSDITVRARDLDDAVRVFIGKTMWTQHVAEWWTSGGGVTATSGSLRTHLGVSVAGWYPIRIDYVQGAGGAGIIFEWSIGGAGYVVVPSTHLSPYGCYNAEVRYDSHLEQIKAVSLAFALQWRTEPRQLESGEFPGRMVPKVRVGQDTDKVLTPDESTDAVVKSSADEVVDTLLADAAGIGDQANAAQLTAESVNYPALVLTGTSKHMMVLSAYESLSDITDPGLLQTRLASMLGLRLSPWEEVASRPRGHRELRDTFPLTAAPSAFHWEPGDGVRVQDPDLDLDDTSPRQVVATSWPMHPDGLGAPTVRFRQRPRSQQDAMRTLVRSVLLPQRNYQGQLVAVPGNIASNPTSASIPDSFARVVLPTNLDDVVGAELVVVHKSDASSWTISVNGTSTGATYTATGRYDILPFLARNSSTEPRMYVTCAGGTGTVEFSIQLLVRV